MKVWKHRPCLLSKGRWLTIHPAKTETTRKKTSERKGRSQYRAHSRRCIYLGEGRGLHRTSHLRRFAKQQGRRRSLPSFPSSFEQLKTYLDLVGNVSESTSLDTSSYHLGSSSSSEGSSLCCPREDALNVVLSSDSRGGGFPRMGGSRGSVFVSSFGPDCWSTGGGDLGEGGKEEKEEGKGGRRGSASSC